MEKLKLCEVWAGNSIVGTKFVKSLIMEKLKLCEVWGGNYIIGPKFV